MKDKITFIIPTRNNLQYLKLCYDSLCIYAPDHKILILDDNSTDGTGDWVNSHRVENKNLEYLLYIKPCDGTNPVGHTILYNIGVKLAETEIICILHADMIIGPSFVENLTKHLKPKSIVSATRIEPPIHPVGKEKIIENFGLYSDEFKGDLFHNYVIEKVKENTNKTTRGFFAPWMMYKEDYLEVGGMNEIFAPYPHEDVDFCNRLVLNEFAFIQSWDSLVWHWTCRGHRWTEEIGKEHDKFAFYEAKAFRNFLRIWGHPPMLDDFSYPQMIRKYNIGCIIKNMPVNTAIQLEPLFDTLYTSFDISLFSDYIESEQKLTTFDIESKFKNIRDVRDNEVIIFLDGNKNQFHLFQNNLLKMIIQFKSYLEGNINDIDLGPVYDWYGIYFYKNAISDANYIEQFKPKHNS